MKSMSQLDERYHDRRRRISAAAALAASIWTCEGVTVNIAHSTKSQKSCNVQHIARRCKYHDRNSLVCKGSAGAGRA